MLDFQRSSFLTLSVVRQLDSYVESKERILSSFVSRLLFQDRNIEIDKLSDLIKIFNSSTFSPSFFRTHFSAHEWKKNIFAINDAASDLAALLEGMCAELFEQVKLVGVAVWQPELILLFEELKDLLFHKMEDLKWMLNHLDVQFSFHQLYRQTFWQKIIYPLPFLRFGFDRCLIERLEKKQKELVLYFQDFVNRYGIYRDVQEKIEQKLLLFSEFPIFNTLEELDQKSYKTFIRLLLFWHSNKSLKIIPEKEAAELMQESITKEQARVLFKDYYKRFESTLFAISCFIKNNETTTTVPHFSLEGISLKQKELLFFEETVEKYKEFLCDNPLGFDSEQNDQDVHFLQKAFMTHEVFNCHSINPIKFLIEMYEQFFQGISFCRPQPCSNVENEIFSFIYEMSQPLISCSSLCIVSKSLIDRLENLCELASTDREVVFFFTRVLLLAMRADRCYHVLFEMEAFHKIFTIHVGLLGDLDDRAHDNRLHQFEEFLKKIACKMEKRKTSLYYEEIKSDLNDIKGVFQDFFASLQRASNNPLLFNEKTAQIVIHNAYCQLLSYRYLFGCFFLALRREKIDRKLIYNHFLFVEQYFDSIENKLQEMSFRTSN